MPDYFTKLNKMTNVSRETFLKLEEFVELLKKWNNKINLVSKKTLPEIWERHVIDSAQLITYIPTNARILTDFGSGGGMPGIILSIIKDWDEVHLIESDIKKCTFLTQAATLSSSKIIIHGQRIEKLTPWKSDIITARALASTPKLVELLYPFIKKSKKCLFLKGKNVVEELEEATTYWGIDYNLHPSITEKDSKILEIKNVSEREIEV